MSWPCGCGSIHGEPVSDARLGPEVARARRVGLDLAPELEHEDPQIVRLVVVIRPPDLPEELLVDDDEAVRRRGTASDRKSVV